MDKGRWLNGTVWGVGLASLLSDMGHEIVTALMPSILAGLGAPPFALGAVEGVSDLLSSGLKMWGGWFTDLPGGRQWRKRLAVIGYVATGFKGLITLATAWPQVLLIRAAGWAGRGMRGPLRDAMLADNVPPGSFGRAFGFHRAMDTLGAVIGPLAVTLLLGRLSAGALLWWSVLPGLGAALAFGLLVGDRAATQHPHRSFLAGLRALPGPFRWFVLSAGLFGLGNFAHTFLILRATEALTPGRGHVAATAAAIGLYTLHNVLYAAGSYPAGALSDRIGKRGLLVLGYALFALMCLGFILLPLTLPALVLLCVLAGIYISLVDAMEGALAAVLLAPEQRGTGYGLLASVNGVGDFLSSLVAGLLWTFVGSSAAFAYAFVLTALGALALGWARHRTT